MISNEDFAILEVKRVIFHDVPQRSRNSDKGPVLSDVECEIDAVRSEHLRDKLTTALRSRNAYQIQFSPDAQSAVPDLVRRYTSSVQEHSVFVKSSQELAYALYEQHSAVSSPGLLAVLDCRIEDRCGIAVLKLEREEGAQVQLKGDEGGQTFQMSILDNLVLTEGTKLFKSALFLRSAADFEEIEALACDSQRPSDTTDELAQFWLRFLGCRVAEDPRISTKKFYEAVLAFINESVEQASNKNDLLDHLISQLTSQHADLAPRTFAEDFIPVESRSLFLKFLQSRSVLPNVFAIDTSSIQDRLRRKRFQTSHGIVVWVPAELAEGIEVRDDGIFISDALTRVGKK